MNDGLLNLLNNPGFLGALLGALITGSIAIVIFKLDISSRDRLEEALKKRKISTNLNKLNLVNSHVLIFLDHFKFEFSSEYTEEKDFKIASYVRDFQWMYEETRNIDDSYFSEKLSISYWKYNRLITQVNNEIYRFSELPRIQKDANIQGLVSHIESFRVDLESFKEYVKGEIKQTNSDDRRNII